MAAVVVQNDLGIFQAGLAIVVGAALGVDVADAFQDNLLAAPVYTRPAEYKGWKVPEVLLSGNERLIKEWELQQSPERTQRLRPDLLQGNTLPGHAKKQGSAKGPSK